MPRNGSGTFNRLYSWEDDAANNIKIRADRMDAEMDGMATALSNSVAVDGQTPITANLPMSGFRHTNVANGTADDDYAAFNQLTRITPRTATDGGTDAFQFDAGGDVADGQEVTVAIPAANSTASPTGENTGGTPTGAQSIVTTEGVAFINMLEARPHRFQWDNANTNWIVLDPAGGVVDYGSDANGVWTRWADGTQLCTAAVNLLENGSRIGATWTFSKEFSSAGSDDLSVLHTLQSNGDTGITASEWGWMRCSSYTTTSVLLEVWVVAGASNSIAPGSSAATRAQAIGRWK